MMDGEFEKLPVRCAALVALPLLMSLAFCKPNSWQPFGYGMRGCIVCVQKLGKDACFLINC